MSLPANSVSTADLVAAARGMHLRDPQPIFKDPYAHLLCGWFFGLVLRFRPLEIRCLQVRLEARRTNHHVRRHASSLCRAGP